MVAHNSKGQVGNPDPREFARKTALITGGSRGIGRAIALKLARHGADIALNYVARDKEAKSTQKLVEREGVRCVLVRADVSKVYEVSAMVEEVRHKLGPIGLLVANAGVSIFEDHREISWESWKKTMGVNADGVFLSILAVKDEMLKNQYGRIVCLSSAAALRPRKLQIHYAASKAAVIALVRCWAEALAPHVRVNGIAPGQIDTEMGTLIGSEGAQQMIRATPLGRFGQPEEVANVAYFLLSDLSSFMTGHTLAVTGGRVTLP
jgi:3-oxoacyl-[acyl-carrier protein] reductase